MNLPEGWKLVPVEPTEEMCRAAESCKYASSSEQWLGGYTPENVEGIYKTMLAVAPTPPAQEDEPVAFVTEENGEQVIDITRLMTLSRGTKIYARPANDELRRAAVALTEYCSGPMKPEIGRMIALTDNLRAVLRENYGTSSRIQ
jgi:hypothetical protein